MCRLSPFNSGWAPKQCSHRPPKELKPKASGTLDEVLNIILDVKYYLSKCNGIVAESITTKTDSGGGGTVEEYEIQKKLF